MASFYAPALDHRHSCSPFRISFHPNARLRTSLYRAAIIYLYVFLTTSRLTMRSPRKTLRLPLLAVSLLAQRRGAGAVIAHIAYSGMPPRPLSLLPAAFAPCVTTRRLSAKRARTFSRRTLRARCLRQTLPGTSRTPLPHLPLRRWMYALRICACRTAIIAHAPRAATSLPPARVAPPRCACAAAAQT